MDVEAICWTSWGTMLGLSLNLTIWIKDDGWLPTCCTPDNDNDQMRDSLPVRDSPNPSVRVHERIPEAEVRPRYNHISYPYVFTGIS